MKKKDALLYAYLSVIPPMIRREVFKRNKDLGLSEAFFKPREVKFSNGISFLKKDFCDKIRALGVKVGTNVIYCTNGVKFHLNKKRNDNGIIDIFLEGNGESFSIPYAVLLSNDKDERLEEFYRLNGYFNLNKDKFLYWEKIVHNSIDDDEFDQIKDDFDSTPFAWFSIRNQTASGVFRVTEWIPYDKQYYENLVGKYTDNLKVDKYAADTMKPFLMGLNKWNGIRGLSFSMLLSAHPSVAECIPEAVKGKSVLEFYSYIEKQGDLLSKLGAIEYGLGLLNKTKEVDGILCSMLDEIMKDDPDSIDSSFYLLHYLFIFVDGRLAKYKLFCEEPPFYRRLASFAHASLIYRVLIRKEYEKSTFFNWIKSEFLEMCGYRTYIDLLNEPRWNTNMLNQFSLKKMFLSRIFIAYKKNEGELKGTKFSSYLEMQKEELEKSIGVPGPLEGDSNLFPDLPDDIKSAIVNEICGKEQDFSLLTCVNAGVYFKVSEEICDLIVEKAREVRVLINSCETNDFKGLLIGLSGIAAVSKHKKLAECIKKMLLQFKKHNDERLGIPDLLHGLLTCSASAENDQAWCDFVGKWMSELAYDALTLEEAIRVYRALRNLLELKPDLWRTCSRAEAILSSLAVN